MLIRPLARSRADQRRFVHRARDTEAIIKAVAGSEPLLLLGERGSGRTSLLNHVAWLLGRENERRDTVLVTGELAQDPAQLLGVLVSRIQRIAEPERGRAGWIDDLRALSMPDGPFGNVAQPAILMELVDLLGERLTELERPVCLMVDGIAPAVAHRVFGSLRNELWTLQGASWVVAGDRAAERFYLEPPADAFFEHTLRLGPFTPADSATLLRAHLPDLSATQIEQAIAAGQGNPRRLLRAAGDLLAGISPTSPTADELANEAAALAGPLARAVVDYLAAHGSAAASDEAMLREIGASRQRASQLMHKLESAGLLETIEEPQPAPRRGRPPRHFAVKTRA
jgi:energy-coupling factor transporter ATP-binding protein EcfA2